MSSFNDSAAFIFQRIILCIFRHNGGYAPSMHKNAQDVGVIGIDFSSPDAATTGDFTTITGGQETLRNSDLEDAIFATFEAWDHGVGYGVRFFGLGAWEVDHRAEIVAGLGGDGIKDFG